MSELSPDEPSFAGAEADPGRGEAAAHESHSASHPGIDLGTIERLTGDGLGVYDVPCPFCGPACRRPTSQRRPVLRIWRIDSDFATYCCARCGEHGYVRGHSVARPDPVAVERARAETVERERTSAAERLRKARWLWQCRRPLLGSIAEIYLREGRRYLGPLPPTLGYLPPRDEYPSALIAAFGFATETEPGVLQIADDAVRGIHLTRLLPDGSDRERGEMAKIMIGRSFGSPIVLAPANDLLGLAVTEGIEDGLSVFVATGLGVWTAGSASRMPVLADAVPSYIECATIYAHDDPAGQDGARGLAEGLARRGIEVFIEGLRHR